MVPPFSPYENMIYTEPDPPIRRNFLHRLLLPKPKLIHYATAAQDLRKISFPRKYRDESVDIGYYNRLPAWYIGHKFYDVAKKLNNLQTLMQIVTSDGTILPLNYEKSSQKYFTYLRLGEQFLTTPDFLVVTAWSPETLESKLEAFNIENMYGPNTLKIFEDIGYATIRNPQSTKYMYGFGAEFYRDEKYIGSI